MEYFEKMVGLCSVSTVSPGCDIFKPNTVVFIKVFLFFFPFFDFFCSLGSPSHIPFFMSFFSLILNYKSKIWFLVELVILFVLLVLLLLSLFMSQLIHKVLFFSYALFFSEFAENNFLFLHLSTGITKEQFEENIRSFFAGAKMGNVTIHEMRHFPNASPHFSCQTLLSQNPLKKIDGFQGVHAVYYTGLIFIYYCFVLFFLFLSFSFPFLSLFFFLRKQNKKQER